MKRLMQLINLGMESKKMEQAGADGAAAGGGATGGDGAASGQQGGEAGGEGGQQGGAQDFALTDQQLSEYKLQYLNEESGEIDLSKVFADIHKSKPEAAPEAYDFAFLTGNEEFKGVEFDTENDPLIKSATAWAKQNGVSQEKFSGLIGDVMKQVMQVQSQMQQEEQQRLAEEWKAVPDAEVRKQKLSGQLIGMMGADYADHIKAMTETPSTFKVLEAMAAKMRDPMINVDNYQVPSISRDDVQVLRAKRDAAEKAGNTAEAKAIEKKIQQTYAALEKLGKL